MTPEDPSGWDVALTEGEWWPVRKTDDHTTLGPFATKRAAVEAVEAFEED